MDGFGLNFGGHGGCASRTNGLDPGLPKGKPFSLVLVCAPYRVPLRHSEWRNEQCMTPGAPFKLHECSPESQGEKTPRDANRPMNLGQHEPARSTMRINGDSLMSENEFLSPGSTECSSHGVLVFVCKNN